MPIDWSQSAPPPPPPPPAHELHIEARDSFLVTLGEAGVALPPLTVSPIDPDRPPHLVAGRVTADTANGQWKNFLEEAYKGLRKASGKLRQPVEVSAKPGTWPDDRPVAGGGDTRLEFAIDYHPTDAAGKKVGAEPLTLTRSVRLSLGDGLRPTAHVEVTPKLLRVYEEDSRGVGPRLDVRVAIDAPAKANRQPTRLTFTPLELNRLAAEWGCPGLEAAVTQMLARAAADLRTTADGGTLRHVPRFELTSPNDRAALTARLQARDARPLRVPVRVEATGAEPAEFVIELHPRGRISEGLVVVDLGTSASVSLRFDPQRIEDTVFPKEQTGQLRAGLTALLKCDAKKTFPGGEGHWQRLLKEVCRGCGVREPGDDPAAGLIEQAAAGADSLTRGEKFFEVVRQLELCAVNLGVGGAASKDAMRSLRLFQERLFEQLYGIYAAAFERVPLDMWNISVARPSDGAADYALSDLELTALEPQAEGVLGRGPAERRLRWLRGDDPGPVGDVVGGRFIDCPKAYLPRIHAGDDLTVHGRSARAELPEVTVRDGDGVRPAPLSARQILQAAWGHLIAAAGGRGRPGEPALDHAAVTYPADLLPEPRAALDQALRQLGMVNVFLDFDESVSPAVFHLEQLFGSTEEIGCEAFKVKCVKQGNVWTYHMLVLDIGAGTTDISLIRLELRERQPDRSEFGGSLYEVTPRLLGAAGRNRTGGHQLTLKLFRVLKQLLARWVHSASSDPDAEPAPQPGGGGPIIDAGRGDPQFAAFREALDRADAVLPTRYKDLLRHVYGRPGEEPGEAELADARHMLERFNALWTWAEDMKVHLSDLLAKGATRDARYVPVDCVGGLEERLEQLLAGTSYAGRAADVLRNDPPQFEVKWFVELAQSAVEPTVKLATKMAESALREYGKRLGEADPLTLQSVVLSGRACALPQVRARLETELRNNQGLGGGRAEILFRRQYAKTATAIGACRARQRIAAAREHHHPPESLNGRCEMDLRIENLFFYLPAAFRLGTGNQQLGDYVFARHAEFTQQGRFPNGVIRSGRAQDLEELNWGELFVKPTREMAVYRDDGDNVGVLWGRLAVEDLVQARAADSDGRDLTEESKSWRLRFELTHRLELSALLLRPGTGGAAGGPEPIFDVGTPDDDQWTILPVSSGLGLRPDAEYEKCPVELFDAAPTPGQEARVPAAAFRPIRCLAAAPPRDGGGPGVVAAWMGPLIDLDLRKSGEHTFYLRNPEKRKSDDLTVRPQPFDPENPSRRLPKFPYRTRYRPVVTADGRFALVIGEEPPYWEAASVEEWLDSPPGRVLRRDLTRPEHEEEPWTDPFCGEH